MSTACSFWCFTFSQCLITRSPLGQSESPTQKRMLCPNTIHICYVIKLWPRFKFSDNDTLDTKAKTTRLGNIISFVRSHSVLAKVFWSTWTILNDSYKQGRQTMSILTNKADKQCPWLILFKLWQILTKSSLLICAVLCYAWSPFCSHTCGFDLQICSKQNNSIIVIVDNRACWRWPKSSWSYSSKWRIWTFWQFPTFLIPQQQPKFTIELKYFNILKGDHW